MGKILFSDIVANVRAITSSSSDVRTERNPNEQERNIFLYTYVLCPASRTHHSQIHINWKRGLILAPGSPAKGKRWTDRPTRPTNEPKVRVKVFLFIISLVWVCVNFTSAHRTKGHSRLYFSTWYNKTLHIVSPSYPSSHPSIQAKSPWAPVDGSCISK